MLPFLPLVTANGAAPVISMKSAVVGYFLLDRAARDAFWRACIAQPQCLLAEFFDELIAHPRFHLTEVAMLMAQPDHALPYRVVYPLTVTHVFGRDHRNPSWTSVIQQLMAMRETDALNWMRLWRLPCMSVLDPYYRACNTADITAERAQLLMPRPVLLREFVRFGRLSESVTPRYLLGAKKFDLFRAVDDAARAVGVEYWRETRHWNTQYPTIRLSMKAWIVLRSRYRVLPEMVAHAGLPIDVLYELAETGPHGDNHYDAIVKVRPDMIEALRHNRRQCLTALSVCVADKFLRIGRSASAKTRRFFGIVARLPYELQAIVAMRYGNRSGHQVASVLDDVLRWALKK